MISIEKLTEIYKSEGTANELININDELLKLFLKGLKRDITPKELARKWVVDWKYVKSEEFLLVFDEITRQTLNRVQSLNTLFFVWLRTIHPRFRWHIKNRILTILGIEQTNLNPEQILALLNTRQIKFTFKQIEYLNLIIHYPDYQKA